MEFFSIVVRNALRHPLRSFLTALGIAVALFAFCMIRTIINAWYSGIDSSAKDRLITRNSVSLTFLLPVAYGKTITQVPGVARIGYGNWFGGIYKDERFQFAQFAVDDDYLAVYPEVVLPAEAVELWKHDRKGLLIGESLALDYGLKPGDVIQLKGTIYPGLWEFTIDGVFTNSRNPGDTRFAYLHWDYLNERNRAEIHRSPDHTGFFGIQLQPGANPAAVAQAIDAQFANSYAETLTETETAFIRGFISMSSTIITAMNVVSGVVIVIMLLVLANTILMSFRERAREYSVLKALGFETRRLSCLVFGEALLMSTAGLAVLFLMLLPVFLLPPRALLGEVAEFFPVFVVTPLTMALAVLFALLVAVLAAALPVIAVARMKVTDGLRELV